MAAPKDMTATEVGVAMHEKLLSTQIWANKIMKSYTDQAGRALANSIDRDMRKAVEEMPQADPLSKAIIMDSLLEVFRLQPDMHFVEIMDHLMKDGVSQDDASFAEEINQLVCSLKSDDKSDSSFGKRPAGSTVRIRLRSKGPADGVLLSRLPCGPPPFSPPPDEHGCEPLDLSSPSEKNDTSCNKRR